MKSENLATFLNDLTALDRDFMHALTSARQLCNPAIADHPTVQVGRDIDKAPVAGIVGVLNGYLGLTGEPKIGAVYDDAGMLTGFTVLAQA